MQSQVLDPAEPSQAISHKRGPWPAFIVVLIAAFMDLLDMTIVNVTVPTLQRDLGASYTQIEWTISGYVLGFAALLITGGRLGDTYGRRRLFLLGVAGFTFASMWCGLSTSPEMLIGSRLAQGMMAGLMVPQVLSIVQASFAPAVRQRAIGIFGGVSGIAAVSGMVVGGSLIELDLFDLSWRPIFLINIPVGVAAIIAGWFLIPESRSATAQRLDPIGMFLAITAVVLLVYPLTEGRRLGWPAWTFVAMVASVLIFAGFVWFERRRIATVGSPLVVLGLFRLRSFSSGLSVWLLFNLVMGGFFLVWTLYMQVGLGWSALHAGLVAATFALGAGVGAGVSMELLVPRYGRGVLLVGTAILAGGFGFYALVAWHSGLTVSSLSMSIVLLGAGVGFGMMFASTMDVVLAQTPAQDAGSASGLLNTAQQLGMALGVALAGVVFFQVLAGGGQHSANVGLAQLHTDLTAEGLSEKEQSTVMTAFTRCVQDRLAQHDPMAVPASCPAQDSGSSVGSAVATAGATARGEAFSRAFARTLSVGIGLLAVVGGLLLLLPKRRGSKQATPLS